MSTPGDVSGVANRLEKMRIVSVAPGAATVAMKSNGKDTEGDSEKNDKCCAACGKDGDGLKKCTACKSVWYCNVSCQKAHRKAHVKRCKRIEKMLKKAGSEERRNRMEKFLGSAESKVIMGVDLSDLFDPAPTEECVICMLPLPLESFMVAYQACCGKRLCSGCVFEHGRTVNMTNEERILDQDKNHLPLLDENCPFCREPTPDPPPFSFENLRRLEKRVELGDAEAMKQMGLHRLNGGHGLSVDPTKALEYFIRSADNGDPRAFDELRKAYQYPDYMGLEPNPRKALEYQVQAAMRGHVIARHNLGLIEFEVENYDSAIRHWRMAAAAGLKASTDKLIQCFQRGLISKEDLEESLRSQHEAREGMKSEERDRFIDWYWKETGEERNLLS